MGVLQQERLATTTLTSNNDSTVSTVIATGKDIASKSTTKPIINRFEESDSESEDEEDHHANVSGHFSRKAPLF